MNDLTKLWNGFSPTMDENMDSFFGQGLHGWQVVVTHSTVADPGGSKCLKKSVC